MIQKSEVDRGDIVINYGSSSVENFFRGICVLHVCWRCEGVLLRLSFDFEAAALANQIIFQMFNCHHASREGRFARLLNRLSPFPPGYLGLQAFHSVFAFRVTFF